MDDRQFDDLVKRLAQLRLSRLEALRGLAASALAGLAGVTVLDTESEAKPHHRKRKGKGKGKGRTGKAQDKHKSKGKGKHRGNNDHTAVVPVTTTTQLCSAKPGAKQPDGCSCKGNGNCQSKHCCFTSGSGSGTCCSGVATTTTPTVTTTTPQVTTTTPEVTTTTSTTTSTTTTTTTSTTTTAAPTTTSTTTTTTTPLVCDACARLTCPGSSTCYCAVHKEAGTTLCYDIPTDPPFPLDCRVCSSDLDCGNVHGAGAVCVRVSSACCAVETACVHICPT